jgi:glycosyltransferase involved in cell wall biosynthesis
VHVDAGPPRWIFKDELWPFMPQFLEGIIRFQKSQARAAYRLLHGNFWMSGWVGLELQRRLRTPLVQIFHATGITKRRHQGQADTSPGIRIAVERQVVSGAARLIAQCPAEERELIDDYGADPGRVRVIPSGVNIRLYHPVPQAYARARVGLPAEGRLVGYIGRMLPRKDVRNLVKAFALIADAFPDARLMMVGGETAEPNPQTTPEIGVLQQLSTELGIGDRLIFTGKRQPSELSNYYSCADVVVTTPWYEPFGLTPLEAMACGRPVIGSAVGGITYTVKDGETGFLVPPRDPGQLASRLSVLLSQPQLRQRMGQVARRRVEAEFTWAVVAQRTANLYQELLSETDRPVSRAEAEHAVA